MKKVYERDKVNLLVRIFKASYGRQHYVKIDTDSPDRLFKSDWDCLIVANKIGIFIEAKNLKDGKLRSSDLSATQALAREDILASGSIHHIVIFHKDSDYVTTEDENRELIIFQSIKDYVNFLIKRYFGGFN